MSIKGSDHRWFRDALDRGDLPLVKATAAELPAVNLDDALSIALLVIEHEPHNAERAAVRWIGRWALESREATLDGLLEATAASVGPRPRAGTVGGGVAAACQLALLGRRVRVAHLLAHPARTVRVLRVVAAALARLDRHVRRQARVPANRIRCAGNL